MRRSPWLSRVAPFVLASTLTVACGGGAPTPPKPSAPTPTGAPAAESKPTQPAAASPAASPAAAKPAGEFRPFAISGTAPTRPVEYVISTNPGGGSDIYARFMIGVIEKHNLSPQPFLPVNRDGGAGAVAMQYLAQKQGDPHGVMITLNSFITTPLLQKLPFTSDSFTPVALMGLDSFFLWVPVDSPHQTLDDFLKAARESEVAVAGTGSKQEDEILFKLIEMRANTQPFRYLPFRGGGDVCTALAGKQVEATVNNPSECLSFYPDKVRPLAAFLDDRSPAFGDLRTAKEQGLDITYANMRGVVAAPGIAKEQQQWHIGLMKNVYDSPDWQDFLQKNALDPKFMSGDEFAKFLDDFEQLHKELLERAGWLQ